MKFSPLFRTAFLFLTAFFLSHFASGQSIDYNENTGQFSASVADPQKPSAQNEKPFWGIWFWEFGDGHFFIYERKDADDLVEMPIHKFADKNDHDVRLTLTPFYSYDQPLEIKKICRYKGAGSSSPAYNFGGKLLALQTNSSERAIPGRPMRCVLNYKQEVESGGYLLVFYDRATGLGKKMTTQKLLPASVSRIFGEKKLDVAADDFISKTLKDDARPIARRLRTVDKYNGVAVFRIENMKKGDAQRLFFTLETSKDLLKREEKKVIDLYVTALWVPDKVPFNEAKMLLKPKKMSLQPVHDPNRIRVNPKIAYFRRHCSQRFEYDVQFLNKGKGDVQHVTIIVPLPKNLDATTFQVLPGSVSPECRFCPSKNFEDSVCYRYQIIKQPSGRDSAIITFYNIGLGAKSGWLDSKKDRRGSLTFSIQTRKNRRVAQTPVRAKILFSGGKPVVTEAAVTRWRQKGIYLRPGMSTLLGEDPIPDGDPLFENKPNRNFSFGLGYQNAPVGSGFVWGWELSSVRNRFSRDSTFEIAPTNDDVDEFFFGGQAWQRESFDIRYLEAKATAGFQFIGLLRGTAGLGISLPATAKMSARALVFKNDPNTGEPDDKPSYSVNTVKNYGLFDKNRKDEVFVLNQAFENRPSPGLAWQWGIELGAMNHAVIGVEHQFRFFPNFYKKGCASFNNFNFYLRFKILPLGGNCKR